MSSRSASSAKPRRRWEASAIITSSSADSSPVGWPSPSSSCGSEIISDRKAFTSPAIFRVRSAGGVPEAQPLHAWASSRAAIAAAAGTVSAPLSAAAGGPLSAEPSRAHTMKVIFLSSSCQDCWLAISSSSVRLSEHLRERPVAAVSAQNATRLEPAARPCPTCAAGAKHKALMDRCAGGRTSVRADRDAASMRGRWARALADTAPATRAGRAGLSSRCSASHTL
eukprot:scaffold10373_cov118-Isochrysis_galbana.AAC.19